MLQNQKSHRQSYPQSDDDQHILKKSYLVTIVACASRAKKQSNVMSSLMDIYLHGSGVKRQVIEKSAGPGICNSYLGEPTSGAACWSVKSKSCQLLSTAINFWANQIVW